MAAARKIDLTRDLGPCYQASAKEVRQLDVPALRYLMVDGRGDPNAAPAYAQAVEALFSAAYAVKFLVKKGPQAVDYGVMPLQCLWWADDMAAFAVGDRASWRWTAMILQPDFVDDATIFQGMEEAGRKKALPALAGMRLEPLAEGRCAQLLHVGPFSEEGPSIERLHAYVDAHGGRRGKHHEIYLSDIRRAAPEKWKTILRQPMNIQP